MKANSYALCIYASTQGSAESDRVPGQLQLGDMSAPDNLDRYLKCLKTFLLEKNVFRPTVMSSTWLYSPEVSPRSFMM